MNNILVIVNGIDILPALPEAVVSEILTSWLEIVDVGRLDSAACWRAKRPALLSVLYSPQIVYDTNDFLEDLGLATADAYTLWLLSRSVRVTGLHVSRVFMWKHAQRLSYLQTCGLSIQRIFENNLDILVEVSLLHQLCEFCPNVTDLTCSLGSKFKQEDYIAITTAWSKLTKISIRNTSNMCGAGLLAIAQNCRELQSFNIHASGAEMLPDNEVAEFIMSLPITLTQLNLSFASIMQRSANFYETVCAANLPCLRELSIGSVRRTNGTVLALAQRCQLQALRLSWNEQISETVLLSLPTYCQLQEISIHGLLDYSPACLATLLRTTGLSLRKLKFGGDSEAITTVLRTAGEACVNLQELEITQQCASDVVIGWQAIALGCPDLRTIRADFCQMSDRGLTALAEGCRKLQSVTIYDDRNGVTDAAVSALGVHCADLRVLHQSGCAAVTDTGLCILVKGCARLSTLSLSGPMCGDSTMLALSEHAPHLRVLKLTYTPGVTDTGMIAVAKHCRKLRDVLLIGLSITNESIMTIATCCKFLRSARFHPQNVTRSDGIGKLFQADVSLKIP
jgi:hypothetical protein